MRLGTASHRLKPLNEAGVFLVVVAVPLVFTPFSASPFIDSKLCLLIAGALLLTLGIRQIDRQVAVASAAFLAAVAIAGAFSLDRWWSLIGTEWRGMGVLGVTAAVVLLCAGTHLESDIAERIPHWLFWTGVAVAAVAVAGRFLTVGGGTWRLTAFSSTIGHRAFVGAFIAAAALAATALPMRARTILGVLVLGSGLSVTAARGAWIGVAVGFLTVFLKTRDWKGIVSVLLPFVLVLCAWTAANRFLYSPESGIEFSAAPRFTQLSVGSSRERPAAFRAFIRAWRHDPVIGSGPGTAWNAYLRNVTADEMRTAGRGFGDAHNIILEFFVTTGALGGFAFLALGLVVLRRALRGPSERSWALGVVAALAVVEMLEPLNLVITPLMFLSAGLAIGASPQPRAIRIRSVLGPFLAIGLMFAISDFTGSSLERYGATYGSARALRSSERIAPWRLLTPTLHANLIAFDYRSGDAGARARADSLVERDVRTHSWNPNVRLDGANVEILLDDLSAARSLYESNRRLFPRDPNTIGSLAQIAYRQGRVTEARRLAKEALRLDPDLAIAQGVLRATTNTPPSP